MFAKGCATAGSHSMANLVAHTSLVMVTPSSRVTYVPGDRIYEIDQLSPEPRYLQLAAILRGQIERGELRSGDALPSQATMVQRYGVDRMTASRAVHMPVEEGLVVIVPGKGAFVARH
jgi:GntR family transcriptional regulator